MNNLLLPDAASEVELARRLARCEEITRWNGADHDEAAAIAFALGNLEKACKGYLESQLPRIADTSADCSELNDALGDVLEKTLRMVLYQIWTSHFFRLLLANAKPEWIAE